MGRHSDHHHKKRGKSSHRQRQKFLQATMREMAGGSFGKYYLRHLTHINTDEGHGEISFGFKVAPSLCNKVASASGGEQEGSFMTTSAVLALFDDLSTLSLVAKDRTFRPGVSVQLSAEMLQPISANSDVVVRTRADKIGKMLGFSSIEMWSAETQDAKTPILLARGRHIKFLPMGWLWDTFLGFGFFVALFLWLYDKFRAKDLVTEIDHLIHEINDTNEKKEENDKKKKPPKKQDESMVEIDSKQTAALVKAFQVGPVAEDIATTYPELVSDIDSTHCHFYQVKVKPFMYNAVKSFHGGAVGLSVEEACVLAKENALNKVASQRSVRIASMDIRYLSAMKVRELNAC